MMTRHKALSRSGVKVACAMTGPAVFGRDEELEQLRERLAARGSFLLHGPAGVGKTLLLQLVFPEFPTFCTVRRTRPLSRCTEI